MSNSESQDFSSINLSAAQLENLQQLGYTKMTPVQAISLPPILQGKDLIAQAKTGSGKTAAFGLGLLQKINASDLRIQALILCPTRELADQVGKELRRLARATPNIKLVSLCGGKPFVAGSVLGTTCSCARRTDLRTHLIPKAVLRSCMCRSTRPEPLSYK